MKLYFSACNCTIQGSYRHTCNDNGECSCKANVINDKCNTCADNFFNFPTCQGKYFLHNFLIILHCINSTYLLFFHFSACNCNTQGSFDNTCNDNGKCSCKANIINDKCNTCADGFYNFPTCQGKLTHIELIDDLS